jgi:hypothetical protein
MSRTKEAFCSFDFSDDAPLPAEWVEPMVCAQCGAPKDENRAPRCPDLRSEFVGGCHVDVLASDAPRSAA